MRFYFWFFMWMLTALPVSAAGHLSAIVNDVPISSYDVDGRVALLRFQNPEVATQLPADVLRKEALEALIDDVIKQHRVQQENIRPQDIDMNGALNQVAAQNNLTQDGLKQVLAEKGVPYDALVRQVRSDLMWLSFLRQEIGPISITQKQMANRIGAIRDELKTPHVVLSEIVVSDEATAQKIWDEINDENPFERMVHKYSLAPSKNQDGHVGKVDPRSYGRDVANVLNQMQIGSVSRPLKIENGWALFLLKDRRRAINTDEITLWEVAQGALPSRALPADIAMLRQASGCDAFVVLLNKYGFKQSVQRGWADPESLPPELNEMLKEAPVNKVASPIPVPQGSLFFMKCGTRQQRVVPTTEEIRNMLEMEHMERISKNLLDRARQTAVIEYK